MTSFLAAYLTVWAFVAVYVLRLRANHQHMTRRIEALENLLNEQLEERPSSRAA